MTNYKLSVFLLSLITFYFSSSASAVGTLIPISSATYNGTASSTDCAKGMAIDSSDNVIVTGYTYNGSDYDYITIKYNNDLTQVLATTVYDSGNDDYADAVALDSDENIIVTGYTYNGSNNDYFTIKYNNSLAVISSVTYNSGNDDKAHAVTVDNDDNIIVAGEANSNSYAIKYNSGLAAASPVSPGLNSATGASTDSENNIIFSITVPNSSELMQSQKYSPALGPLSSQLMSLTFSNDGINKCLDSISFAQNVAIDSEDNIIMTGFGLMEWQINSGPDTGTYGNWRGLTGKFDANGVMLSSSAVSLEIYFNSKAYGVAVDCSDNIIISGESYTSESSYHNHNYYTVKYDPGLAILSSAVYDGSSSGSDIAYAAATDSAGNIFVTGGSNNGTYDDWFTIKYLGVPPAVTSITSQGIQGEATRITINGTNFYSGAKVSFSGTGIMVSSVTVNSTNQISAVVNISSTAALGLRDVTVNNIDEQSGTKLNALEIVGIGVNYVTPVIGRKGDIIDITIAGENFVSTPTVTFSGTGITINSVTYVSSNTITANITISTTAAVGIWDITVTNISGPSATLGNAFTVMYQISNSVFINSNIDTLLSITAETGDIVISIPQGTFSQDITLQFDIKDIPASDRTTLKEVNIGIDITPSLDLQLLKDFTITIHYRDSDIAGLDEDKLVVGRYDEANARWVLLPTVCYPDSNYVVATVNHLSQFGLFQKAPSETLRGASAYPNPYKPGRHSAGITFDYLTTEAKIKIYNVAGELVKEIEESDGDGLAVWDGKNNSGNPVASGIYIAYIKSDNSTKKVKIAIIK